MKSKIILFIFISIFLVSCNANKKINGKYRSNFADLGFYITAIELKADSTFHYELSGDLLQTELTGKYKIKKSKLYLRFYKLKGEREAEIIKISGKDTIVNFEDFEKIHFYELKKENEIEYHLKYKISNDKLQSYNFQTGNLVRKGKKSSNSRRYLIFGPKYHMKKRYLKKIAE